MTLVRRFLRKPTLLRTRGLHASAPRERLPLVIATVGIGLAITTRYVIRAQERVRMQREAEENGTSTTGQRARLVLGLDLGSVHARACGLDVDRPNHYSFAVERMAVQIRHGQLVVGDLATKNAVQNLRDALLKPRGESILQEDDVSVDSVLEILTETLHGSVRSSLEMPEAFDERTACVLALPSAFNSEPSHARLRELLGHAGLDVLDFVPEPVAAVLAVDEPLEDQTVAVFDMGGTVSTCSILDLSSPSPTVLSSISSTTLSGDGVTAQIVDYLAQTFEDKHGIDLRQDSLAVERLFQAAEAAKHELSTGRRVTQVHLPFITADQRGAKHLEQSINAATMQRLMDPSLTQSAELCHQAMRAANVSSVDAVVMAGGGLKSPILQTHILHAGFPSATLVHLATQVDQAVALGATKRAQQLLDEDE
ncbi:unnamed protein product [Aphanomyces euteiches]|uniref:Uncharacterized protein n=1 Tax=Aphanomyces euteiches TaxID=100861 RepID=A0A6G0WB98_9STRA|nr:hypothetical protein Ae201684_016812 [Aphanomyces euteiches]KAH9150424.1 hypothetical protein AeRB84_006716 [Aphanomyces euteiches]